MSSGQEGRKAERERLRNERKQQESKAAGAERTRLFVGYGIAGILVAAVAVGLIVVIVNSAGDGSGSARVESLSGSTNDVALDERSGTEPPAWEETDLQAAAQAAGCEVELDLPEEGRNHLDPDAERPDYRTDPPTSGNHVNAPYQQADGAYVEKPKDIFVVHSLEHGRIAIQYDPSLPEEDQLALRGLYDTMYAGALLFPNPDMPYAVAVTAWRSKLGCEEYQGAATLDAIRAFGTETFGRSPEPATSFGPLDGPTPARPESVS